MPFVPDNRQTLPSLRGQNYAVIDLFRRVLVNDAVNVLWIAWELLRAYSGPKWRRAVGSLGRWWRWTENYVRVYCVTTGFIYTSWVFDDVDWNESWFIALLKLARQSMVFFSNATTCRCGLFVQCHMSLWIFFVQCHHMSLWTFCPMPHVLVDFFCPMPPHVLVDLVVLPPGHGSSVTDCWGCDAHEAQLPR